MHQITMVYNGVTYTFSVPNNAQPPVICHIPGPIDAEAIKDQITMVYNGLTYTFSVPHNVHPPVICHIPGPIDPEVVKDQITMVDNGNLQPPLIRTEAKIQLCELAHVILQQIWAYVPFEFMTIQKKIRNNLPITKELEICYVQCFQNFASCFDLLSKDVRDDLVLKPLVYTVNKYPDFMHALSNRAASCLSIVGHHQDIDFFKIANAVMRTQHALLKNNVTNLCRMMALATSFSGYRCGTLHIPHEFSNDEAKHQILASGIKKQRILCQSYETRALHCAGANGTILNIWCTPTMKWEKINVDGTCLTNVCLAIILAHPTLRILNVSNCSLDDSCAALLAEWLTKQENHEYVNLVCEYNNFTLMGKDIILQAYRARAFPTSLSIF